ncbi:MAG: XamI family restriction endonuclease [Planctomycetales bacterium]|nr:XamI family restriction endonuclease [Planctomycetales bacterium]
MAVNSDKPTHWKADIARSVDFFNDWFMKFAPQAYRESRVEATKHVEEAFQRTKNLIAISPKVLREFPAALSMLRMATAPPIARDRLVGLAGVSKTLVNSMETKHRIPPRFATAIVDAELKRIGDIITRLVDRDILTWLVPRREPQHDEVHRAATIIADRLCGSTADPIVRNAQEQRQLAAIKEWLEARGYSEASAAQRVSMDEMAPGTFAFRMIVQGRLDDGERTVKLPMDAVVMPKTAKRGDFPLLIEAKSAGDFTNTNKRRKEEAVKVAQLRSRYGKKVRFILLLCGYFDSGYLGYEAAEGIDWVWEHRLEDLAKLGI